MKTTEGQGWTIDALGAQTARALAVDYEGPPNDRVRDVPDRRTIRYYTMLGLVDRPAGFRGRTALYGRRHLMQLVAIKRLQARGLSLAEVQRRLVGLTDAALAQLARLPRGLEDLATPGTGGTGRASGAFWSAAPAPAEEDPPEAPAREDCPRARAMDAALLPLQGVRLDDEATLLLGSPRPVDAEDARAIRKAAAPLLQLLRRRRLLRPRPEGGTDDQDITADGR